MLSEDNDELTQEEYESILNKFVALQDVIKERNYKLKKMEDEMKIDDEDEEDDGDGNSDGDVASV